MALVFTSLKNKGLYIFGVLVCAVASLSGRANAQTMAPMQGLPLLFDAREHLPLPDLSAYPRLRFLTTTDFPPFNFTDQSGRLAGFHVDLVREICTVLSIEDRCQIQAVPFAELETALAAGQGDAVIAGVAVTASKHERFAFSRPYLALPARFVATRQALKAGQAVPAPGWRVGVVAATAHEAMAKAWFPDMRPQVFETQEALLDALKAGKIDAGFADALRLSFWVSGAASQACCALAPGAYLSERFLGEGLAIMVRRQNKTLSAAFDHALAELATSGRLEEIYLRYFPLGLF